MKRKIAKSGCCLALTALISFACTACGGGEASVPYDPTLSRGYTYEKESDSLFQFFSSDMDFDSFLNEYMERHLRYNENAVNSLSLGYGNTVWKEWESMAVMFMDTSALTYDPKTIIRNSLENIYQDRFGYIWVDNGTDSTQWGQGWEFPNTGTNSSYGKNKTYSFSSDDGWTARSDTNVNGAITDGKYVVSGSRMKRVTYTGPAGVKIAEPFCAPFVDISLELVDRNSLGATDKVEDIYLYFMTDGDTDFSDGKKVSYSSFGSSAQEKLPVSSRVVFPMYANSAWSDASSITGIKIEIVFKESTNAEVSLDAVRLTYDARQINNNGVFINAAANYFKYTQDTEFLARNMAKIRRAMQFYLTYCEGYSGLVTTKNFVGHDGSTNEDYMTTSGSDRQGIGSGIGDGYWDCLSYPQISSYCNNVFYNSLRSMRYLEKCAEAAEIQADAAAVKDAQMDQTLTYDEDSQSLGELLELSKKKYNEAFWDETAGRYHLGINKDGDKVDYGFTMFNQEAIQFGLADGEQAEKIMTWINGEREISSDTSKGEDIYFYTFAPRWTTKKNDWQYWWTFDGRSRYAWGHQIQNGGTSLHQAYYDLAATALTNGVDKSFEKFLAIKEWYNEVAAAGGSGTAFYLKYYQAKQATAKAAGEDEKVWIMQGPARLQNGTWVSDGAIGLDSEFLEAAILCTSVPDAYFGFGFSEYNTLDITPRLPSNLGYMKMENCTFGNLVYDVSVGDNFVQVNSVRGARNGEMLKVTLKKPSGSFEVRQHNTVLTQGRDYTVSGDSVIISVPFKNGRIQTIQK